MKRLASVLLVAVLYAAMVAAAYVVHLNDQHLPPPPVAVRK
jgi:hypothetical protein